MIMVVPGIVHEANSLGINTLESFSLATKVIAGAQCQHGKSTAPSNHLFFLLFFRLIGQREIGKGKTETSAGLLHS